MQQLDRLLSLKREFDQDPTNSSVWQQYLSGLARLYGETTVGLLESRTAWNSADELQQDAAIGVISQRLANSFELLRIQKYACAGLTHRVATLRHRHSMIEFQLIPGGPFRMGTEDLEAETAFCERYDSFWDAFLCEDEAPARWITVRPFLLSRTPITNAQWHHFDSDRFDRSNRDCPVSATWEQSNDWLRTEDPLFRMPNEEEWEYACRSGSVRRFFWGDEFEPDYCWYEANSNRQLHSVLEHESKTNSFGFVDMLGNAAEWCSATASEVGTVRVHRGGSCLDSPPDLRPANRDSAIGESMPENFIGLRVAMNLPTFELPRQN